MFHDLASFVLCDCIESIADKKWNSSLICCDLNYFLPSVWSLLSPFLAVVMQFCASFLRCEMVSLLIAWLGWLLVGAAQPVIFLNRLKTLCFAFRLTSLQAWRNVRLTRSWIYPPEIVSIHIILAHTKMHRQVCDCWTCNGSSAVLSSCQL